MIFPKISRLLKRSAFLRMRKGRTLKGKFLILDILPSPRLRLGITTSRRYGRAHQRNRFRRIAREAFRSLQHELPPCDLHIIPRRDAHTATSTQIASELRELLILS